MIPYKLVKLFLAVKVTLFYAKKFNCNRTFILLFYCMLLFKIQVQAGLV